MGAILSYFWGNTGRTDDPDPITGLTSRERYLVQSSWKPITKDLIKNGSTLLTMFFEQYPHNLGYFPFKDIPIKDLPESKKFLAHCNSVMYSFSSIVDHINDSELLVSILTKIGEAHQRRKNPAKAFWELKKTMLELFGKFMSKEHIAAWDKALDVAFKVIVKELEL